MTHNSPTGRRNHGRPLKRLLDTWDRNGSTSGPTPLQIDDDDNDDDDNDDDDNDDDDNDDDDKFLVHKGIRSLKRPPLA